MGKHGSDDAWNQIGRSDPYYGVLTDDRNRADRLDSDAKAEFFRSGEEHISFVSNVIREQLCHDFQPRRALDFGCGVGRLAIPFARMCSQVVGVDVSEGMLEEARKNSLEREISNIEFVLSDDHLSRVRGAFDLVHSFIVLQHIPTQRGLSLIRALVDLLSDGGVGVLHLTYARRTARMRKAVVHWMRKTIPLVNGLVNVIQGRPFRDAMMQMNSYDMNQICLVLQEKGCNNVCMRFTDHGGHLGVVLFFMKEATGKRG